jgi:DeoR/GlpR family transcriptional regulator of sugar metabolism
VGPNIRQEQIVHLISTLREVSVQALTRRFEVSAATIRKDLTMLEEMGYLVRTHGGALLAEDRTHERPLADRRDLSLNEKKRIVEKAKEFIRDGDTIFLDSGSTCALLARAVRQMTLRVLCHSLGVIEELKDSPAVSLISLGGSYRKDSESFIGQPAIENLHRFRIQSCFVGAAGFTDDGVFTSQNTIEAELKSEVLSLSKRRFILADHTKYNAFGFSVFARPGDFDVLISDSGFRDADRLSALGVEVVLAR